MARICFHALAVGGIPESQFPIQGPTHNIFSIWAVFYKRYGRVVVGINLLETSKVAVSQVRINPSLPETMHDDHFRQVIDHVLLRSNF
jgi:hypothetical protein